MIWQKNDSHGTYWLSEYPGGYAIVQGEVKYEWNGYHRVTAYLLIGPAEDGEPYSQLLCQRDLPEQCMRLAEYAAANKGRLPT